MSRLRGTMENRRNGDVGIRVSRHNAESRRRVGIKYTYAGRKKDKRRKAKKKTSNSVRLAAVGVNGE
jgi:hypothetical protein